MVTSVELTIADDAATTESTNPREVWETKANRSTHKLSQSLAKLKGKVIFLSLTHGELSCRPCSIWPICILWVVLVPNPQHLLDTSCNWLECNEEHSVCPAAFVCPLCIYHSPCLIIPRCPSLPLSPNRFGFQPCLPVSK